AGAAAEIGERDARSNEAVEEGDGAGVALGHQPALQSADCGAIHRRQPGRGIKSFVPMRDVEIKIAPPLDVLIPIRAVIVLADHSAYRFCKQARISRAVIACGEMGGAGPVRSSIMAPRA